MRLAPEMKPKPRPQSPKSPNTLKPTLSSIKSDLETVDCTQMTPVMKIQCAMKKVVDVNTDAKKREGSKINLPPCCHPFSPKNLLSAPASPASKSREESVEKKYGERSKVRLYFIVKRV